jgi:hypothetical protein
MVAKQFFGVGPHDIEVVDRGNESTRLAADKDHIGGIWRVGHGNTSFLRATMCYLQWHAIIATSWARHSSLLEPIRLPVLFLLLLVGEVPELLGRQCSLLDSANRHVSAGILFHLCHAHACPQRGCYDRVVVAVVLAPFRPIGQDR